MKKIISILISSVLLFSLSFSTASASEAITENTSAENATVEFIFDEGLSEELKAKIEAHLLGESKNSNSRGILCDIFGHDLVATNTIQVTHKVRATSPRCLEDVYKVEACEDCDYVKSTLISSDYIYCCT